MWIPIVEGDLAEECRSALDAIAALAKDTPLAAGRPGGRTETAHAMALFWGAYLDWNDSEWVQDAYETAIATIPLTLANASLGNNYIENTEALAALWVYTIATDEPDVKTTGIIERQIEALAANDLANYPTELLAHVLKVLVVRHRQGNTALTKRCVVPIVELLRRVADQPGPGMYAWPRTKDGNHYNLGLAHGIPQILVALAYVTEAGLHDCSDLIEGGVRWMASQRLPYNPKNYYGTVVTRPGKTPTRVDGIPSRTAYCFGDLGVAAGLWNTCRRVGQDERPWLGLAREVVSRDPDLYDVTDPSLCHGAFGTVQIFNRFFQASRDAAFLEAARFWLRRGLAFRADDLPGGGYASAGSDGTLDLGNSLWAGAIGSGLALMSAIGNAEPMWDYVMDIDIPPLSESVCDTAGDDKP